MRIARKQNVLQLIKQRQGEFSNQHAKIADYVVGNYEKAAFLSATHLAHEIGVSQPTVIRFSQFLGFPQYALFLEAIQDLLKEELTSTQRLKLSLGRQNSGGEPEFDTISKEINTLGLLAKSFPHQAFKQLVEQICRLHRVYIVGTRGSSSLAQFFGYFLSKVKQSVMPIPHGGTRAYDKLLDLSEQDLVIAIAFPRYPRETIEIARYCRDRGAHLVAITDKMDSPLAKLSNHALVIPITFSTIFDSYCSVMCLFNMIVTAVGRTNRIESEELSKRFEALAKEVNIFL